MEGTQDRIPLYLTAAQVPTHVGTVGIEDVNFAVVLPAVGHQFGTEGLNLARRGGHAGGVADHIPSTGVTLRARLCLDYVGLRFFLAGLLDSGHIHGLHWYQYTYW